MGDVNGKSKENILEIVQNNPYNEHYELIKVHPWRKESNNDRMQTVQDDGRPKEDDPAGS